VRRIGYLARKYWFDVLVAVLAIVAMLEVVLGRGSSDAPTTTLWFCIPAIAVLVSPIFARRRFPLGGPAAYWVLGAAISFVDPLLIPFATSLFPIGMADAFLLGNLRSSRRTGIGLAVVVVGAAILVYNIPGHSADQLVFVPSNSRSAGSRASPCATVASRPQRPKFARAKPNRSGTRWRGSRWPRNGRASRGSCTTSSRTPSA
jgi:hypothetical protein